MEAVADLEDKDQVPTALLAVNPGLFPAEERRRLMTGTKTPLFLFGFLGEDFRDIGIHWSEGDTEFCFFDPSLAQEEEDEQPDGEALPLQDEPCSAPEPVTFFDEMNYRAISDGFYRKCAAVMRRGAAMILEPVAEPAHSDIPHYQIFSYRMPSGIQRCLIGNNNWQYILGELQTSRVVAEAKIRNGFQLRPIHLETTGEQQSRFSLRIPPKGVGVVDLAPAETSPDREDR